jgi:hypothetical protein
VPRAVLQSILIARTKYINRFLDTAYGLLDKLLYAEIDPEEFYAEEEGAVAREDCIRSLCGSLARGLSTVGLPVTRPATKTLRHVNLRGLYRRFLAIPCVCLDDLLTGREEDSDLKEIRDEYFEKIRNILEGINDLPPEFEEYLNRPFEKGSDY